MREASNSRLPRAKEAKSLKLGEPECGPIAAAIHLCATSHTCHRSHTPFLESCLRVSWFGGKSIHAYSWVTTSYFPLLKSATKVRIGGTNLTVATNTLPLLDFQELDWTKKSKCPLCRQTKTARFAQWIFCKHYDSPPSLSACTIPLLFGFFCFLAFAFKRCN